MRICIIAAASENNVIGRNGKLPWHLPDDMKFFKEKTDGHPLIMGRKTFASLPGLLPNRRHIVVTRDGQYHADGVEVASSLDEAMMFAKKDNLSDTMFVIGGGEIYAQAMEKANVIYLTRVHADVEGDVFFPPIDPEEWEEVESTDHPSDDKHEYAFTFQTFKRKSRLHFAVQ